MGAEGGVVFQCHSGDGIASQGHVLSVLCSIFHLLSNNKQYIYLYLKWQMLPVPALVGWLYKHHLLCGGAGEKWHELVQGHFWFILESLHPISLIKNCQFTLVKILVWRKQTIGVGQLKSYSCLQIRVHFQTLLKPVPEVAHLLWCAKWWKRLWPHVTVRQARAAKKSWKDFTYPAGFVFACLFIVLFVCLFAFLSNMKSPFGFIYAYACK